MKAWRVEGLDPSGSLQANASRIVRTRLEELRGFAGEALAPEAAPSQHNLRIAAKRLRYVLEIFGPCIGPEAKPARRAAKQLQSVLGDLHDCDLMLPKVEHIPTASTLLRERRERLFGEFVAEWRASEHAWSALTRHL